jgi:FtsP/CotA-like multicopper oxidase with cupredoxin domain
MVAELGHRTAGGDALVPHPHGRTADHVYRGVAGMFILDDPASRSLTTTPSTTSPLIIQDKRLHDDGEHTNSSRDASPAATTATTSSRSAPPQTLAPSPPVPDRLATHEYPEAHDATRTRRFELSREFRSTAGGWT